MSHYLTTKQVLGIYGIAHSTLDAWMGEGCPVHKRGKGRAATMYSAAKLARWVERKGKNPRGLEGRALRESACQPTPDPVEPAGPVPAPVPSGKRVMDPVYQLESVRAQYTNLMGRFVRAANSGDDKDVASISRALSTKGGELRQLELAVLDWRKQTGSLVDKAEMQRLFVELASGTRERIMALPNELAPVLREYLRDPDDVGKVRDEIDQAIRHALAALPDELPERTK